MNISAKMVAVTVFQRDFKMVDKFGTFDIININWNRKNFDVDLTKPRKKAFKAWSLMTFLGI